MHHARMVRACAHRARGGRRDEPNVDDSGSKLRNLHNSPRGESSLVSIKGSLGRPANKTYYSKTIMTQYSRTCD